MKRLSLIAALVIIFSVPAFSQEFDKKNLLFRVNPEGKNTVELLGFEKKPKEVLIIPEEVSYKGTKYIVSTIGDNAFNDCEVLTKVVGISVQEVKKGAFSGCKNLISAVFTNHLKKVGNRAFNNCCSLQELVLGENIQSIEEAAFLGCTNLKELSLGNSLKHIGGGFINETGISSIILPSSLSNVGHNAFANNKVLSSVILREGIKHIDNNAFTGTTITSLSLPETIETIGNKAFADCDNLKSITIGKNIQRVGENAFADCDNLQSITFFEGLKSIATGAFARTGVTSLTFPNSLKDISSSSFEGCKSLQSITLGKNIESIREKAFAGCSSLSVDFSDVPCDIASDAFLGCKEVIIGDYSLKLLSKCIKEEKLTIEGEYKEHKFFINGLMKVSKNGKFGYINKMGKQVIPCIYDDVHIDYGVVEVSKDGKHGFYSLEGELKAQCVYDKPFHCYGVKYGIGIVEKDGKFGFIDVNGKEILPCTYDGVRGFCEGIGWCTNQGIWYIINKDGKFITKITNIIGCSGFIGGIATVLIENNDKYEWRMIDKNGNSQLLTGYQEVLPCGYGFIRVKKDGKYGLIDKKQNVILPAIYDEIKSFEYGMAIIQKIIGKKMKKSIMGDMLPYDDIKEGAIDSTGRIVIPCNYESVYSFYGDYTRIRDNGKEWYVNKSGKILDVDFVDCNTRAITDGDYLVMKNGKWGCVDRECNFIATCKYDKIEEPHDGMFVVRSNEKSGYIDKTGKEVIPLEWSYADDFHDGLAEVMKDEKIYFIDKSGKAFHLDYNNIGRCNDGMIPVMKDGKLGYVDKTGKLVVPCIYTVEEDMFGGYDDAEIFSEGLALVKKGNRIGFVDKNGKSTFDY